MLIVCTKDLDIVKWANDSKSGASNWGSVIKIKTKVMQPSN
ncbi:MAG: hypothetical protein FD167_2789 [bacterium]|nr:MAG: hypothetical protein FD167_2789 [bacterium]